ncbi:MAG: hypothetical protein AAF845_07220 [Bacteroidota bacterium]
MSTCPADFALRWRWREGSVPPPGHYRLGVDLAADGTGTAILVLGYGSGDPVEMPFALGPEARTALHDALTKAGLWTEDWCVPERRRIGGSHWDLTVTADGETVTVPPRAVAASGVSAAPIEAAVRAAVPEAVWDEVRARRTAYRAAHG